MSKLTQITTATDGNAIQIGGHSESVLLTGSHYECMDELNRLNQKARRMRFALFFSYGPYSFGYFDKATLCNVVLRIKNDIDR